MERPLEHSQEVSSRLGVRWCHVVDMRLKAGWRLFQAVMAFVVNHLAIFSLCECESLTYLLHQRAKMPLNPGPSSPPVSLLSRMPDVGFARPAPELLRLREEVGVVGVPCQVQRCDDGGEVHAGVLRLRRTVLVLPPEPPAEFLVKPSFPDLVELGLRLMEELGVRLPGQLVGPSQGDHSPHDVVVEQVPGVPVRGAAHKIIQPVD